MTGLAVLLLSWSGCKLDVEGEAPTHKTWHGYCVCGYCDRADFYVEVPDMRYYKGTCPPSSSCVQAVEVMNSYLGNGTLDDLHLYCLVDWHSIDYAISHYPCDEAWDTGNVQPCLDRPECVSPGAS